MVNITLNVAKTILALGVAAVGIILAVKVTPAGAEKVLGQAAGAADMDQFIESKPEYQS